MTVRLTELLRSRGRSAGWPGGVTDVICEADGDRPRIAGFVVGDRPVQTDGSEPGPDGVWLVRDVLDVQVVDESGHHRGRVGDLVLVRDGEEFYVASAETGVRPVLSRCHLAWLWPAAPGRLIPWGLLRPLPGRVHAFVSPAPPRGRRYRGVFRVRRRAPS